ncbi:hypothetical protein Tco_1427378 [Tanacetum coccineum]
MRVGSNGNSLWEASVLLSRKKGGVRVEREDDRGVSEGREDVREVFQQRGSRAKRKLSRCGRNQMGNEPILALPGISSYFCSSIITREARIWKHAWKKKEKFEAKYHLGKANVVVELWSRKKSEAKNEFWIDV